MSPKIQHPEGRKPWIPPRRAEKLVHDVQHGRLPGTGLAFDLEVDIIETLLILFSIASFLFLLYNFFFPDVIDKLDLFSP